MPQEGANPDELSGLAHKLDSASADIDNAWRRINTHLGEIYWQGLPAELFRSDWEASRRPEMERVAGVLLELREGVEQEAESLRSWSQSPALLPGLGPSQNGDPALREAAIQDAAEDPSDHSQWYLLRNENPNAKVRGNGKRGWYHSERRAEIRGIVVHTTEGPTGAGLATAAYLARVERPAAAHVIADLTGIIRLLPDSYEAFHARNGNRAGLGLEIQTYADNWGTAPQIESKLIRVAAAWSAIKALKHGIPPRRLTFGEWEAGERGFIAHRDLDPSRRTDPGANFPWQRFLELVGTGGLSMPEAILTASAGTEVEAVSSGAAVAVDASGLDSAEGSQYTVESGDNMWVIAERRLSEGGGEPSVEEVAAYWKRLIAANEGVIRSGDPDLIFPGEVLVLPEVQPHV